MTDVPAASATARHHGAGDVGQQGECVGDIRPQANASDIGIGAVVCPLKVSVKVPLTPVANVRVWTALAPPGQAVDGVDRDRGGHRQLAVEAQAQGTAVDGGGARVDSGGVDYEGSGAVLDQTAGGAEDHAGEREHTLGKIVLRVEERRAEDDGVAERWELGHRLEW